MDIPPKESGGEFVKRWYGYDNYEWTVYAENIFNKHNEGSVYVETYNNVRCTIWGTEETTGKNFIKYSATFIKNLGEI